MSAESVARDVAAATLEDRVRLSPAVALVTAANVRDPGRVRLGCARASFDKVPRDELPLSDSEFLEALADVLDEEGKCSTADAVRGIAARFRAAFGAGGAL